MAEIGCGCKLCRTGNGQAVNDLATDGLTIRQVREWIATNLTLSVTDALLKRHFEAFEIPIAGDSSRTATVIESEPPIAINAREALASLDLGELFGEPSNPGLIIDKLQSLHIQIHFRQALLLNQHLGLAISGDIPAVSSDIYRDTKITFELMARACGLDYLINQAAALDAVARMGFDVSPVKPTIE